MSSHSFLEKTFADYAWKGGSALTIESILLEDSINLCEDFDRTLIQDSWSYRNVQTARQLAFMLIDEKGMLDQDKLEEAIACLKKETYSLGPERHHDDSRRRHLLKILTLFSTKKEYLFALKKIQKPEFNLTAEHLIRETLGLLHKIEITVSLARRAVLASLLTKLRQNVGSCFATAPAILVHEEKSLQFLADIADLFGTGRLSRTFEGVQYTVPLSPSWGVGDLFRPIVLAGLGDDPVGTLSHAPGLLAAFEKSGLMEEGISKKTACERLLRASYPAWGRAFFLTPDTVIKETLLLHFNLQQEDIHTYLARSWEGPLGELVGAPLSGYETKSYQITKYLKARQQAISAFKALTDNALLKAWEFSLASFAEAKADFTKWNFYLSMGVSHEEPNGIGRAIYEEVQKKIHSINKLLEDWQLKYEYLFIQAKYLEGRMKRAGEGEINWLRAEYEISLREIDKIVNERDELYERGNKLANLYNFLISFYGEKIPEYFQEIYDAEMHDVSPSPYDDSPAGFRLMYKHGRANPSLWTHVHSREEYIHFLNSFFVSTEVDLVHRKEVEGIQKEVSSLITTLIATIKTPEFLISSIYRLARAYNEPFLENPLENLDQVKRKPWVYVSGGAMATLVSCYFGTHPPQEAKRSIENEKELLEFYIDFMKELPWPLKKPYLENDDLSMLAFSPTHAFLLKPGWDLFRKGWDNKVYTYTWIRDEWLNLQLRFLDENILQIAEMKWLIQEIVRYLPAGYRSLAFAKIDNFTHPLSTYEFRDKVVTDLSYERFVKESGLKRILEEEIDSLLFRMLPFFPAWRLEEHLREIMDEIKEIDTPLKENVFKNLEVVQSFYSNRAFLSSQDLKNAAKGALILALKKTKSSIPFHKKIIDVMQKKKFAYPKPFLVADSNWVKNVFGFVVNPGTQKMDFWRFDESGSEGRPISVWRRYLEGRDKHTWGLYQP